MKNLENAKKVVLKHKLLFLILMVAVVSISQYLITQAVTGKIIEGARGNFGTSITKVGALQVKDKQTGEFVAVNKKKYEKAGIKKEKVKNIRTYKLWEYSLSGKLKPEESWLRVEDNKREKSWSTSKLINGFALPAAFNITFTIKPASTIMKNRTQKENEWGVFMTWEEQEVEYASYGSNGEKAGSFIETQRVAVENSEGWRY